MLKNELLQKDNNIVRVLEIENSKSLIIDCIKRSVPQWIKTAELTEYAECSINDLSYISSICPLSIGELDNESRCIAYKRFTIIAGVLPFIADDKSRCNAINNMAQHFNISKQTVKQYLWLYLAYQNISVLAPKKCCYEKPLTNDERNIRWALNKYYYNQNRNSLQTAYTFMLKEKYCDCNGTLLQRYPTIHQFRYFYRKHKKMQNYYISRDGIKNYQRNNRPLTGDGIQSFAPAVGVGMLDATICDIYLINESGNIIGRPILTACIDAYSSLCCGYSLSWEGGVYSLRNLMLNVTADKVKHCKKFGIDISQDDWNCNGNIPGVLVTDMGSEYKSENFEQIAELGVTVINLPPYRPELKGAVEKFFDLLQNTYKPHLKGKGIIEPDFQERGAHDYRKDACLTMEDFEKIVLHCIIYYNSQRIIENFPYTVEMFTDNVKPYASHIWNWNKNQPAANLIKTNEKQIALTLLPRTKGTFSRHGLRVNKMRYHCDGYTESYLHGGTAIVAFNPDNVSSVWVIENSKYTEFTLIESRFTGKSLEEVRQMQSAKKHLMQSVDGENLQAKIDLAEHIKIISNNAAVGDASIKAIRETRQRERTKQHIDIMGGTE
ncbi:MAG: DDE-type integrase/transposase/recombinase [Ruminococcus sp.]|nr:DDE-type integrase/transposase/recombinase [Ruminococcus sp.]